MASSLTRPTVPTLKRLFGKSGNRCAFPGCSNSLVDDDGTVIGEVCHIRGRRPDAQRYDPDQSPEERHGFDNLILLCGTHHTVIDADARAYSVERLTAMKHDHESSGALVPDGQAAAAAISVHQSGGITAQSVAVETANFYGEVPGPTAEGEGHAIALVAPELARILANQIRAQDRAIANFICSSTAQAAPGDHWTTFVPRKPTLYPSAAQVRDLRASDSALLAEFYNHLQEIDELISGWKAADTPWDTNVWNFLMQKIDRSVAAGVAAAERLCPGRKYDSTMPAAGTLADRAAASAKMMRQALDAHIARFKAKAAAQPQYHPGRRLRTS